MTLAELSHIPRWCDWLYPRVPMRAHTNITAILSRLIHQVADPMILFLALLVKIYVVQSSHILAVSEILGIRINLGIILCI